MSSFLKMMTDAGDQYLATLSEMQENLLKATSAYKARFATAAAATPAVENPFATMVPSTQELAEANFSFAQKLLKQQKSFTEKLLAASAPAGK